MVWKLSPEIHIIFTGTKKKLLCKSDQQIENHYLWNSSDFLGNGFQLVGDSR